MHHLFLEWVLERWQVTPPVWVMPLLASALVVGLLMVMFREGRLRKACEILTR